jgi:hypothetical protein
LNSEGGSSSSTYTRDLEEKHKILINRRTSRRGNRSAPVRSARISPRASGAPPSAIPAGSGQDGPAFGRVRHTGPPRRWYAGRTDALTTRCPRRRCPRPHGHGGAGASLRADPELLARARSAGH